MKVLFCSIPEYGHWFPLMPLAEAVRDASHDVTFATGAGAVPAMRALGFAAVPAVHSFMTAWHDAVRSVAPGADPNLYLQAAQALIWPNSDRPARAPDLGQLGRVMAATERTIGDAHRRLDDAMAGVRPDLVVYEETLYIAATVSALRDIPAVAHSVMTLGLPSVIRTTYAKQATALWASSRSGPMPISPYYGNLFLDTCPPGFGDHPADPTVRTARVRPVPWGRPGDELPSWTTEPRTRPLVYVTMGTVGGADRDRLRAALDGAAALPVDVLVAGDLGGVPVPPSVRAVPFLRQDLLLPHVDIVVHHGGSGTTTGCLANGVPQLMLPWMADQFQNADAVVRSGAGKALRRAELTASAVTAAIRALLDDDTYAKAAANLARTMGAMAAPADVVPTLTALV